MVLLKANLLFTLDSNKINKKNFLFFIFSPIIVYLSFSELILRLGEPQIDKRSRFMYQEIINRRNHNEIFILGSSISLCSLNPSELNIKKNIYNYSVDGASNEYIFDFYNRFLSKYERKPDYVILPIGLSSFDNLPRSISKDEKKYVGYQGKDFSGILSFISRLRILNVPSLVDALVPSLNRIYKQKIKQLIIGPNFKSYDKGYVACYKGEYKEKKYEYNKNLEAKQISKFKKILNIFKENNIKTIVLTMPTYKYHEMKKVENYYDRVIKNLGNNSAIFLRGEKLLKDFSNNKLNFADHLHMTEIGSKTFSNRIGTYIEKLLY